MGFQDVPQVLNVFPKMFPIEPHFVPYALPKLHSTMVYIAGQKVSTDGSKTIYHCYFRVHLFIFLKYLDGGGWVARKFKIPKEKQ
jgi:hypothetical protein